MARLQLNVDALFTRTDGCGSTHFQENVIAKLNFIKNFKWPNEGTKSLLKSDQYIHGVYTKGKNPLKSEKIIRKTNNNKIYLIVCFNEWTKLKLTK